MCAADNAAHMVQGRLRIGTADAKTTAVQRKKITVHCLIIIITKTRFTIVRTGEKNSTA